MDMDGRTHESIQQAKRMYYQIPCLAHYNAQNENIITTDASTKGLGELCGNNKKTEIQNQSDLQANIYRTQKKNML